MAVIEQSTRREAAPPRKLYANVLALFRCGLSYMYLSSSINTDTFKFETHTLSLSLLVTHAHSHTQTDSPHLPGRDQCKTPGAHAGTL